MTKVNGKLAGSLNKALGNRSSVAGFSEVMDYTVEIARMETEDLYRHGSEEYKVRPSKSKNARQTFEKKCVAEFRKATGQNRSQLVSRPKLKKKAKTELDELLNKYK